MNYFRSLSQTHQGLLCMLLSSLGFSAMWGFVYGAQIRAMEASSLLASGIRIVVHLAIVVAIVVPKSGWSSLWGDKRPELWLRGAFGAVAMICTFAAIKFVGIGEAAFLRASNGIFIALLAPFVLKQRTSPLAWMAIAGGLAGLFLLSQPRLDPQADLGRLLGLGAGVVSAFAYMMIGRSSRSNNSFTIMFYLCLVTTGVHILLTPWWINHLPTDPLYWTLLVFSGALAAMAQYFLTRAYALAPASLNVAMGYSNPALNFIVGIIIFETIPDIYGWIGASLILIFGVCLPFLRPRKELP